MFEKFNDLRKNVFNRGTSLFHLGREIINEGVKAYHREKEKAFLKPAPESSSETSEEPIIQEEPKKKSARKNLEKNLSVPDAKNQAELARQTSLKSHEVIEHDLGEGQNSNMWQRNFDNHQGN